MWNLSACKFVAFKYYIGYIIINIYNIEFLLLQIIIALMNFLKCKVLYGLAGIEIQQSSCSFKRK